MLLQWCINSHTNQCLKRQWDSFLAKLWFVETWRLQRTWARSMDWTVSPLMVTRYDFFLFAIYINIVRVSWCYRIMYVMYKVLTFREHCCKYLQGMWRYFVGQVAKFVQHLENMCCNMHRTHNIMDIVVRKPRKH